MIAAAVPAQHAKRHNAVKTPAYKWGQMDGEPVHNAAEVQGLEKATNTRYGKAIAQGEETGTILEAPRG